MTRSDHDLKQTFFLRCIYHSACCHVQKQKEFVTRVTCACCGSQRHGPRVIWAVRWEVTPVTRSGCGLMISWSRVSDMTRPVSVVTGQQSVPIWCWYFKSKPFLINAYEKILILFVMWYIVNGSIKNSKCENSRPYYCVQSHCVLWVQRSQIQTTVMKSL